MEDYLLLHVIIMSACPSVGSRKLQVTTHEDLRPLSIRWLPSHKLGERRGTTEVAVEPFLSADVE